jgi:hypothetical protein
MRRDGLSPHSRRTGNALGYRSSCGPPPRGGEREGWGCPASLGVAIRRAQVARRSAFAVARGTGGVVLLRSESQSGAPKSRAAPTSLSRATPPLPLAMLLTDGPRSDCRRHVAPESARTTTSSQGQYVSQCKVTYFDTDTPKGTALMSWWPTLEWPDARQSAIALEAASVSSATCVAMFGFQGG